MKHYFTSLLFFRTRSQFSLKFFLETNYLSENFFFVNCSSFSRQITEICFSEKIKGKCATERLSRICLLSDRYILNLVDV